MTEMHLSKDVIEFLSGLSAFGACMAKFIREDDEVKAKFAAFMVDFTKTPEYETVKDVEIAEQGFGKVTDYLEYALTQVQLAEFRERWSHN